MRQTSEALHLHTDAAYAMLPGQHAGREKQAVHVIQGTCSIFVRRRNFVRKVLKTYLTLALLSRGQREVHNFCVLGKLHVLQDNERTVHTRDGPVLHSRLYVIVTYDCCGSGVERSHNVRHLECESKKVRALCLRLPRAKASYNLLQMNCARGTTVLMARALSRVALPTQCTM